ncbi:MAG: IS1 family transposase [archaeon]
MARTRANNKAVCQNPDCSFYRRETGKDIVKRGQNTAGHQRYYCNHCNKYLVETKGTPLYQKKLSERKIKAICKELVEKKGVRAISRTLHVNKNTICSLLSDVADHALSMTNYLVHDLRLETYEVDEKWPVVKQNKKNISQKQMRSLDQARRQLQHA